MTGAQTPLLKRWGQIKRQILSRKTPHAVLSWRYLCTGQTSATKLHLAVFKNAWPMLPRSAWWLIACYSYSLWFLWHGWRQLFWVWQRIRPKHAALIDRSLLRQGFDLTLLTFANTVPAIFYFQYQLYRLPEKRWLDFIYAHELPHWHLLQSPDITETEQQLLNDKQLFAESMAAEGLPSIPTIDYITSVEQLTEHLMRHKTSIFIKPVSGSRNDGCFALEFNHEQGRYQLENGSPRDRNNEIIRELNSRSIKLPLIIQPLHKNHPEIDYGQKRPLAVIRLITAVTDRHPHPVSAILELPFNIHGNPVLPLKLNIATGAIGPPPLNRVGTPEAIDRWAKSLEGQRVPRWSKLLNVAQKAHRFFPNVHTIGWDLAVTDDGIVLLEGNINWAVAAHQIAGQPLLGRDCIELWQQPGFRHNLNDPGRTLKN